VSCDRLPLAVEPEDLGLPCCGRDQSQQQSDGRRLSYPRSYRVADHFASPHVEVEVTATGALSL
jgi:hypothetical protein